MEQRDFIMQQIEQMGRVLGKLYADLFRLKANGRISEGMQISQQVLKENIDLNLEEIIEMKPPVFIEKMKMKGNYSDENLERLCDSILLLAENLNNPLKQQTLNWCLRALEYLDTTSGSYNFDRQEKIKSIKEII